MWNKKRKMQITSNFGIMRVKLNSITGEDGVCISINTYIFMCVCVCVHICVFICTIVCRYTYRCVCNRYINMDGCMRVWM